MSSAVKKSPPGWGGVVRAGALLQSQFIGSFEHGDVSKATNAAAERRLDLWSSAPATDRLSMIFLARVPP